jgi:HD-GYP domain-containing protein (c-di-GMP phosphodiesterase class II)
MDANKEIASYLSRANQAAQTKDWQVLAQSTLELLKEICQAEAALLFHPDHHIPQTAWLGCPNGLSGDQWEAARPALLQPGLFQVSAPSYLDQASSALAELHLPVTIQNLLVLPMPKFGNVRGGYLVINSRQPEIGNARLIADRMATELEKAAEIKAASQRETRLRELNDILGELGASLDPNQVLRMLIEQARQFLQVEAVSLFLIDEQSTDLVLQVASQADEQIHVEQMRVPAGKGIIGYVTQTGETVLVEDARGDQRHYEKVDQTSGFSTRSILAVPLRTRSIDLGQERGTASERIIGGLEAINKLNGPFQPEDPELLQALAKGAATILVVARLYNDANKLFLDVIQAIIAVIDAKDPYTRGHSQRVSQYSVEVARELGLEGEKIYQVRLGSLFHDVGKIGIPDRILRKRSQLKPFEMRRIRQHTRIGENIMGNVRLMHEEIPAMVGHHERLDGSGYPGGLHGDEIALISRIVAVADVFDALTSDRPYRKAMPVEEVFAMLRRDVGTSFDGTCVESLIRGYRRGVIRTQAEQAAATTSLL